MRDGQQNAAGTPAGLRVLYPVPGDARLEGLYLGHDLRRCMRPDGSFVYSNFVASLDGRVAVAAPESGEQTVPPQLANPRDWRLLLELAAPADALIVSGRYVRQLGAGVAQAPPPLEGEAPREILKFRAGLGLPPQPALVVLSNSLDLPFDVLGSRRSRPVLVATSDAADGERARRLAQAGVEVIRVGGRKVDGGRLIAALAKRDLRLLYSVAGPAVLHTLLAARILRRLYMTTVLRILGGEDYATLARGPHLDPAYDFRLAALYLDPDGPDGVQQLLQVFDCRDPSNC